MTVLCSATFILAPRWLIIEPKAPKSLKTIYRVLKFAWKHKAPLNRSALTYWEEDIPSRLDLGKSRYGGPFTTEQVEDVKTFFKIIMFQMPLFIVSMPSWKVYHNSPHIFPQSKCDSMLLYYFTYDPSIIAIVVILISEFLIFPLVKCQPPTILKQICIASFLLILANFGLLIADIVSYFYEIQVWIQIAGLAVSGLIALPFLYHMILQFVCAQSPYNMRGLLTGLSGLIISISFFISYGIYSLLVKFLTEPYHHILYSVMMLVINFVGFVLYCLLARWYKMRVRDEEYNVHRVVEEVYDRYLSNYPQQQTQN